MNTEFFSNNESLYVCFRTSTTQKSSTPKICSGFHSDRSGTSTYSMSQGLAAILNERDLLITPPEGTVPKPFQCRSSNPPRFPTLVSETHFSNSHVGAAGATETVSSSAFGTITSPSSMTSRLPIPGSGSQTITSSEIKTTVGDSATANVIERLRNTGFSIYGLLSGAGPSTNPTRPNSLPVSSSGAITMATGSSTVTVVTGSMPSASTDSLVTVATSRDSDGKSSLRSIFTHKTAGGVVGALANFKRNGIL